MTSSSKLLPAESLTAIERWELPSHDPLPPPGKAEPEEVAPDEVPPITLEQIEKIQKEAYEEGFRLGKEEGFATGQREGLKAGEKAIRLEIQRLNQIMQSLADPLADVDERVEEELTVLAITIARQLIRRELRARPEEIVGTVREAMNALPAHSRKVRLHLHPEDAVIIRENMQLGGREDEAWQLMEDPTLTRGGCRIATEHSQVDATIEKRLNAVIAQVLGGGRSDDRTDAAT